MSLILLAFHILAASCWVGGIFFAYMALRPAAPVLEPPARLLLWSTVLGKFFPWVWLFILVLIISGYGLMGITKNTAPYVYAMQGIGWLMFALFAWLYFYALRTLKAAVAAADVKAGAAVMARMRPVMATNLLLGMLTIVIGATGPYWVS